MQKPDCSTGAISKRSSTTAVFRPAAESSASTARSNVVLPLPGAPAISSPTPGAHSSGRRTASQAHKPVRATRRLMDVIFFERKGSAAIHECRTAHARPVPARQRNKAVRDAIRKTVHRISADGLKAVLHQRVRRRQHACIRFFSPTAVYGNKPCAARRAKRHRAARTQADFRNVPPPTGAECASAPARLHRAAVTQHDKKRPYLPRPLPFICSMI